MDLHLNAQGRVSFSSDPVPFEGERLSAARGAIPESQPAPLGEEVPVALFLEDGGTSMKSLTPSPISPHRSWRAWMWPRR